VPIVASIDPLFVPDVTVSGYEPAVSPEGNAAMIVVAELEETVSAPYEPSVTTGAPELLRSAPVIVI
jgi:hypothetical protein